VLAAFWFSIYWTRHNAKKLGANGAAASGNKFNRFKWAIADSLTLLLLFLLVSMSSGVLKYLMLMMGVGQALWAFLSWKEALSDRSR
jgi:hypothetical protein